MPVTWPCRDLHPATLYSPPINDLLKLTYRPHGGTASIFLPQAISLRIHCIRAIKLKLLKKYGGTDRDNHIFYDAILSHTVMAGLDGGYSFYSWPQVTTESIGNTFSLRACCRPNSVAPVLTFYYFSYIQAQMLGAHKIN